MNTERTVRKRKIRILHDGQEFFLVDRGHTASSRVITLLKRVDAEYANGVAEPLVHTDVGPCAPVAQWTANELRVEHGFEEFAEPLRGAIDRYLEEFRVGRRNALSRSYWFISRDREPLYTLSKSQPNGLSVLVYRDQERAAAAAREREGIDARPIQVERIEDLADFLCARATEGFAGSVLDDVEPIFFCLDANGAPRFLRLSIDARSGRLDHSLLEEDGSWERYEGEEEIDPEIDQDLIDRLMASRLGDVPFLGFHEGVRLHRLGRKDAPDQPITISLADDELYDGEPVCPVFHDLDAGRRFLEEHDLDDLVTVPVENLKSLASWCRREGRPMLLHPDDHRARGGTIWIHDDRLVLDSFSGLWFSDDGGVSFERQ